MSRAVVTSETPAGPVLLSIYGDDGGLACRVELSPRAALHLALDLLGYAVAKGA